MNGLSVGPSRPAQKQCHATGVTACRASQTTYRPRRTVARAMVSCVRFLVETMTCALVSALCIGDPRPLLHRQPFFLLRPGADRGLPVADVVFARPQRLGLRPFSRSLSVSLGDCEGGERIWCSSRRDLRSSSPPVAWLASDARGTGGSLPGCVD